MSLLELVNMAKQNCPIFKQKLLYWEKRNKVPNLNYLITHCKQILGDEFCELQARKYLKTLEEEVEKAGDKAGDING